MEKIIVNIISENANKTIAFGSDHAGFAYKEFLKQATQEWGYDVIDCGTHSTTSVDYSDYVPPVVQEVRAGARGILICGSGIGMSIGANRFPLIRAALCGDVLMAKLAREHNDANILVLGERLIGKDQAIACVKAFLETPFLGGRHAQRVEKLDIYDVSV
jgi:ribose 5-phosphate isomerase B